MSELINMHKRIAMGGEQEANHLKKGGKVAKFAKGGQVEKLDTMPVSYTHLTLPTILRV